MIFTGNLHPKRKYKSNKNESHEYTRASSPLWKSERGCPVYLQLQYPSYDLPYFSKVCAPSPSILTPSLIPYSPPLFSLFLSMLSIQIPFLLIVPQKNVHFVSCSMARYMCLFISYPVNDYTYSLISLPPTPTYYSLSHSLLFQNHSTPPSMTMSCLNLYLYFVHLLISGREWLAIEVELNLINDPDARNVSRIIRTGSK